MITIQQAAIQYWGILFLCTCFVVVYVALVRRLADQIQPMRLKMADTGMYLLDSEISEKDKITVCFMLEHTFSYKPAVALMILFPIVMVRSLFLKAIGRNTSTVPEGEAKIFGVFAVQFLLSAMAANPMAGLILILEFLTFGLVGFLVGGQVLLLRAAFTAQRAEALGIFSAFRENSMGMA